MPFRSAAGQRPILWLVAWCGVVHVTVRQHSLLHVLLGGGQHVLPLCPFWFNVRRPGVSVTPNRYGPGRSNVGESPMRAPQGSSDMRGSHDLIKAGGGPSSVDRLSAGFSKMSAPSAGMGKDYGLAQRWVGRMVAGGV